jgi:hypothetical protein
MGLNTPLTNANRPRNDRFRYKGGCAGGKQESPVVGPSDHLGIGQQLSGQPNKAKSVIGQNKEWSTGG